MTPPWLSVLMPTYNGSAYLGAALDSVVAEDDPGIECIAVDDGSTDDTLAILERYRDRLDLTILAHPHAGNWVANTNRALKRARGDFACLLHQDDTWLAGRLATLRDAIARHPSVDLFLHPAWFIDSSGRRLGKWCCPLPKDPKVLDAGIVLPRLLVQNFIAIPSPMFKTVRAREVGGLDEALWYTADWDLWLKLAAVARTVLLPEPMAGFRFHAAAQTNLRSVDIGDIRQQQEIVLERHVSRLPFDGRKQQAVRRCAELSIAVNVTLAGRYHGVSPSLGTLAAAAWRASPLGVWRYLRYSRIRERVSARLRALRRAGGPDRTIGSDAVVP